MGDVIRASAEVKYAAELEILKQRDQASGQALPPGWVLSPKSVRTFIIGDGDGSISRKFYGDDPLVDRAIVTLLGKQGLMLVGEPGTAKSMLSELLAAAISGDSNLTIQGTAGTTEDHIRYSWNYALLLAEGPTQRALVPSPVYQAMASGKIIRFEEITRAAPEVQDTLVSLLSEKQLMVPEFGSDARISAQLGFNIVATANLRDRGVNEMSAALKRRFNFETVKPISERRFEIELVTRYLNDELGPRRTEVSINPDVIDLLVTAFRELRSGTTESGTTIKRPETVMSTAEAVNVAYGAALEARYLGNGTLTPVEVAHQLSGVALKDSTEDSKRLRFWVDNVVKERARRDSSWKAFYGAARSLWN